MYWHHKMKMNRSFLAIVLILFCVDSLLGTQNKLFGPDLFNGTAATALHTYDANWISSVFSNSWFDPLISTPNGGVIGGGANSGSYRTNEAVTADQYNQGTFTTLPTAGAMAICLRMTAAAGDPAGGYCVGTDDNLTGTQVYQIWKVTNKNAPLTTSATVAVNGDVVNWQIVNTTMTVKVNGSTISDLTTVDATYATGNPGIFFNTTTGKLAAYEAGSVTSTTTCNGGLLLRGTGGC